MRSPNSQSLPRGGADSLVKGRYRDALAEGRERTLELVEPVSTEDLDRVHDPLMSPLVWDLGHIAAFEDLWLGQRAGGLDPLRPELAAVYDASETPRVERGDIPYLRREDALEFMAAVRERSLRVLERVELSSASDRLNANGFVWEMLVRHEHQHNETMLQTLQLALPGTYTPTPRALPAGEHPTAGTVRVGAGPFEMGTEDTGFLYDNERPRHRVEVAGFAIDRTPVTNGEYSEFAADGGYRRRELWAEDGWRWRGLRGIERPLYWRADGTERRFERIAEIDPLLPVMHVSWFEADAFARWAGARLPTEAEWEKAATWDSRRSLSRPYPWGYEPPGHELANLDQTAFGPARVGSHDGVSPEGVGGLIGDCWEWTATDFGGYPGFRPFPYPQYSQVFFGLGYKVLRGGSWATRSDVARSTFRNWDLPQRRQIFAGFRCVREW
ncbi:MAG: ergothioneine biosynthesis protein EgtB [Thermoleophilaceae bacterium]